MMKMRKPKRETEKNYAINDDAGGKSTTTKRISTTTTTTTTTAYPLADGIPLGVVGLDLAVDFLFDCLAPWPMTPEL